MAKSLLIWLQVILAVNVILADITKKGFKFMGTIKPRRTVNEMFDYYVSDDYADWYDADADCKDVFGSNATLLSLLTEKEMMFTIIDLDKYSSGATFWSDGIPDTATEGSDKWRWSSNNQLFESFIPWACGRPTTYLPTPDHRALFYHESQDSGFFLKVIGTELHRYICKVQRLNKGELCNETNDLVVVLDASASIGTNNYNIAKDFVARLVASFTAHQATRVSFIIYSDIVSTVIDLSNKLTPAAINSKINGATYIASNTATDLGINEAIKQFSSNPRNVPRNMVLLTDGVSNYPNKTLASAANIISMGVRTFSVGISLLVRQEELLAIAGGDPTRVFITKDFQGLIELLVPLSHKVCSK